MKDLEKEAIAWIRKSWSLKPDVSDEYVRKEFDTDIEAYLAGREAGYAAARKQGVETIEAMLVDHRQYGRPPEVETVLHKLTKMDPK